MPMNTPALSRGWLRDLMRGIRQDGVQPRDPRIKALWDLLRRRQLLARDPWARNRLRYIWQKGLNVRPRPRTTHRLLTLLRSRGVMRARPLQRRVSAVPGTAATMRRPMRPLQPVALRRVATLRPVGRQQPMRPVAGQRRGR
jgi:hypothetical protein